MLNASKKVEPFSLFDVLNVALTHCMSIAKRAPIHFLSIPQLSNFVEARLLFPSDVSRLFAHNVDFAPILRISRGPFVSVLNSISPIVSIVVVVSVASRAWE